MYSMKVHIWMDHCLCAVVIFDCSCNVEIYFHEQDSEVNNFLVLSLNVSLL